MADQEKRDPMVEHVVSEFVRYEAFHRERFEKMRKIYDHWKNKPPKRDYSWQNAVHVPVTVEGEQTITPRIFTALFPSDAPVDVHVEGDASEDQGIRIKALIQHYFRVIDVQGKAHPTLTQNTLFGTGYLEGGSWYVRKGWQIEGGDRYYSTLESRPDAKFVDFFEIFPHPAKLYIGDGLPLIRRNYCDAEALKRLEENDNLTGFKNLAKALESESIKSEENYQQKKRDEYEILQYWGPWDAAYLKDDKVMKAKAVPYWIIVVNRSVCILGIPNPYNHQIEPFCKTILFPDPKPSWFGVGIGEIGLSSQERLNKIVNQRLDNVDLVLNKQGVYNGNDSMINTKRLQVAKPGLWHKVSDIMTSMKWIETPDVTSSSYNEEKIAKDDYREATGAVPQLMPTDSKDQHRTAMGIQLLQGAAGMRFRPVLRRLETDLIQQLAMFFFSNLKQFMTEEQWVVITGKQGRKEPIKITPEQIQAKVLFIPTGISETMNKEIQVGQLLRYKEITANDPTVNRQEINRRIAELMGFKDIDKLLTPMPAAVPSGQPGELPPNIKMKINQRLAEGATPEQIKQELLGARP